MQIFSCDLVANAQRHKIFLSKLHLNGTTLRPPSLESLRRYTELWLPLVASHNHAENKSLVPPDDVSWLWHCHRLAPARYEEYCIERFAKIIEAENPFEFQISSSSSLNEDENLYGVYDFTRKLWNEQYPNEPFYKPINSTEETNLDNNHYQGKLRGLNLLESCSRQVSFLWQVSGDRFDDPTFLSQGVDNYYKFLQLKGTMKGRNMVIVPTYQIDLMWHTHMLCSITMYNNDCRTIMGSSLNHDDSLNDRAEGGILDVSFRATKVLWKEIYGEEYTVDGGMYRGEPSASFFLPEWPTNNGKYKDRVLIPDNVLFAEQMYHHLVGVVGASSTGGPETSNAFPPNSTGAPESLIDLANASTAVSTAAIIHADVVTDTASIPIAVPVVDGSVNNLDWISVYADDGFIEVSASSHSHEINSVSRVHPLESSFHSATAVENYAARWIPVDADGAFERAGSSNNLKKDGYIFGDHESRGRGYYSILTREAFELMFDRIHARIIWKKFEIDYVYSSLCGCCMFPVGELENQLLVLMDLKKLVQAMLNVSNPCDPVELRADVRRRLSIQGWNDSATFIRSGSRMGVDIGMGPFIVAGGYIYYQNAKFFCDSASCGDSATSSRSGSGCGSSAGGGGGGGCCGGASAGACG